MQSTPVQFVESFHHMSFTGPASRSNISADIILKLGLDPKNCPKIMREKQLLVPAVGAGALMDST